MALATFLLHSTYVLGQPRIIGQSHGKQIVSCISKQPVPTSYVELTEMGLGGDRQQDREVHGGVDKAVYAWNMSHYGAWAAEPKGVDLLAGMTPEDPYHGGQFGENLLLVGDYPTEQNVRIGDIWAWGDCLVEVSQPREPCFKLTAYRSGAASNWMIQSGRCGWYLRLVSQSGAVPVYGAQIELLQRGAGSTIAEAFQAKMHKNGNQPHGPR